MTAPAEDGSQGQQGSGQNGLNELRRKQALLAAEQKRLEEEIARVSGSASPPAAAPSTSVRPVQPGGNPKIPKAAPSFTSQGTFSAQSTTTRGAPTDDLAQDLIKQYADRPLPRPEQWKSGCWTVFIGLMVLGVVGLLVFIYGFYGD